MAGETGMVIQLADNIATLFLDSSRKEVKLFTRDLTESADIVAGIDRRAGSAAIILFFTPATSLVCVWHLAVQLSEHMNV